MYGCKVNKIKLKKKKIKYIVYMENPSLAKGSHQNWASSGTQVVGSPHINSPSLNLPGWIISIFFI